MRNLFVATTLILPLLGTPALAGKAENCKAFGELADAAVVARRDGGLDETAAATRVAAEASKAQRIFKAEIPQIVNWIYSLPEDMLTDEVGQAASAQCMAAG